MVLYLAALCALAEPSPELKCDRAESIVSAMPRRKPPPDSTCRLNLVEMKSCDPAMKSGTGSGSEASAEAGASGTQPLVGPGPGRGLDGNTTPPECAAPPRATLGYASRRMPSKRGCVSQEAQGR